MEDSLGVRIKKARTDAGMTQKELAQQVGVPYQTVQFWENGKRKPKIENIRKIADAVKISWYALLGEEDDLHGLAKAIDSVEYDSKKERPMVDSDGNLYLQDLKTLEDLKDRQFKDNYAGDENFSHSQIVDIEERKRYLDNLFFCLNENGQNLLTEMARAICVLDNYRIPVLSLSDFLAYEKTVTDKLASSSWISKDKMPSSK